MIEKIIIGVFGICIVAFLIIAATDITYLTPKELKATCEEYGYDGYLEFKKEAVQCFRNGQQPEWITR